MALKLANFATSKLAANLGASDTALSVQPADAAKFPSLGVGDWCPLVLRKATGEREIVKATARASAVITIERAQENTTALEFSSGDRVDVAITEAVLQAIDELTDIAAALSALLPKAGGTMTGPIVLAADPAASMQPATKNYVDTKDTATRAYVDGIAANLGKRSRVRVASTANINLSAPGASIEGVTMASGDEFLAKDQSTAGQVGVYTWNGAAVAATRVAQFDAYDEFPGSLISVAEGTTNADTLWLCTSNKGGTLGTTAIVFSQVRIVQPASDTVSGIVELATVAETLTGTDATRALTPAGLAGAGQTVALTDAATIAVNMATFKNATLTLGGNRTLGQPSNATVGKKGFIRVTQDGTGGRTLAFHSDYKWAAGTAPSLSAAAGAVDVIRYEVQAANVIVCSIQRGVA